MVHVQKSSQRSDGVQLSWSGLGGIAIESWSCWEEEKECGRKVVKYGGLRAYMMGDAESSLRANQRHGNFCGVQATLRGAKRYHTPPTYSEAHLHLLEEELVVDLSISCMDPPTLQPIVRASHSEVDLKLLALQTLFILPGDTTTTIVSVSLSEHKEYS